MKKLRDYIAESEKQLAEKAVSQQQQKFMGMVHAAQKGKKPASQEVAKVAKSMSKKDAKDFAKTKHAGLPKKVSETSSKKTCTNESIMEAPGDTLTHIISRFKHEVKQFEETGTLDDDLYDELFDYYSSQGEMPYGIAKARTGDPYNWISNKLSEFLDSRELGEEVNPLDIPAYRRKSNSRLGVVTPPLPVAIKRSVSPENIPAVQRKAANKDFPVAATSGSDSSIDIIRKMAGLPPRK